MIVMSDLTRTVTQALVADDLLRLIRRELTMGTVEGVRYELSIRTEPLTDDLVTEVYRSVDCLIVQEVSPEGVQTTIEAGFDGLTLDAAIEAARERLTMLGVSVLSADAWTQNERKGD